MTQFYKQYRNLFVDNHPPSLLTAPLSLPTSKMKSYGPLFLEHPSKSILPATPTLSPIKSRSDLQDEFQRQVLPKLQKYYLGDYTTSKKVKTETQQNNKSYSKEILLPTTRYPSQFAWPKKDYVTENPHIGYATQKPHVVYSPPMRRKQVDNPETDYQTKRQIIKLNQNLLKLQNQYMLASPNADRMKKTMLMSETTSTPTYKASLEDKWQTKILPNIRKKTIQNRKAKLLYYRSDKSIMYSVATSLDSLLYFRPYNAYAFINAKLQAIKDTTRYYSRKNINEFKEAIYRRKDRKKELLTRKQALRKILASEQLIYTPQRRYY